MDIHLQHLVPIPLKEKFAMRTSDIWNTNVVFQSKSRLKIVAPSGTGKTTLMNTMYKLRFDYNGSIAYDDKDIKDIDVEEMSVIRKQKLSIIFQDLRLFEHLSARENIELCRIMQKPIYESNVIDEMAQHLGITHILHQKTAICSYGEQQRVAIIRALIKPFEWLLMDEPFSHLDNDNTQKAVELIYEECTKRNAGFILTDLDEDSRFNYTNVYKL